MKEFERRFKGNNSVNPIQAIPLSREISEADNEFLTKDVIDQEILDAIE